MWLINQLLIFYGIQERVGELNNMRNICGIAQKVLLVVKLFNLPLAMPVAEAPLFVDCVYDLDHGLNCKVIIKGAVDYIFGFYSHTIS